MLEIDLFDGNLTSGTLLENGCRQNLSIMTNFESLVCIQMEAEIITVCHFHSELFLNLNNVYTHVWYFTVACFLAYVFQWCQIWLANGKSCFNQYAEVPHVLCWFLYTLPPRKFSITHFRSPSDSALWDYFCFWELSLNQTNLDTLHPVLGAGAILSVLCRARLY